MPEAEIAKTVRLLDLALEFFADDSHWARGYYDNGKGGHCLVGALLHLSRKHRLPITPVIALLHDALPKRGLPVVHFNDTLCNSAAELRSVLLKARRLALEDAERDMAAAAVEARLVAEIEKHHAAQADTGGMAPDELFATKRLAA
jgi:hypothetical protein